MTLEPLGRSLSDFTVELDVYSGPYEWLLALILKDELEIFEIPPARRNERPGARYGLRWLGRSPRPPEEPHALTGDRRRYGRHRGRASLARGTRRKAH
jgi:hypothetical protein